MTAKDFTAIKGLQLRVSVEYAKDMCWEFKILLKNENGKLILFFQFSDEEIGGHLGMEAFVKTDDFKKLNVGFSLDEGVAATDDSYLVYYAERTIWRK